jgi:hypothetical protein
MKKNLTLNDMKKTIPAGGLTSPKLREGFGKVNSKSLKKSLFQRPSKTEMKKYI